ncbi:hypothetical protein EIP91_009684 [Steccherinum ochraceum]|uniref:P-loop containing nucleoside triphosphate hydrolase protein n=1 Tax=Steccherinum ochraceum TaxID=92696 RepID=A0A4V2MX57_9APHY|nr:hypothetical protein EIP91_009684 [Steccherinum ochraceum]
MSLLSGDFSWPRFGSQQVALQDNYSKSIRHSHAMNSSSAPFETVPYAFEVSYVPLATVALSCLWIITLGLIHGIARLRASFTKRNGSLELNGDDTEDVPPPSQDYVESLGGVSIFCFRIVRALACIALLTLSAITLARDEHWYEKLGENANLLRVGTTVLYAYATLLAFKTVMSEPARARRSVKHLIFVLLGAFVTLGYRNLWPLATFTFSPIDPDGTPLLWAEIAVLTFATIIVPLFVPRQYVPYDPKDPTPVPNPEQTASVWSLWVYSFMDPVIFLAYRIPHLSLDQLPPLSDYDRTKNLVKRSFKHLDPFLAGRKRHLFSGLLVVFRWEYVTLTVLICARVVSSFASPLGVNRLLNYMETDGEDAFVRPWFWIVWLFMGPAIGSVTFQRYHFVTTRVVVQAQGILTQLLFDHALRIRVKADTQSNASAPVTSDTVSLAEESSSNTSGENTVSGNADGEQGEVSSASLASTTTKEEEEKTSLVGKLNTLATADMESLMNGRDFLFVILYIPLQLVLCVVFLYQILGWSAYVGLAVIALMFPIPGLMTSRIQQTQVEKMKKTDARVQSVTEIMNVIRMIKLFGWESKVNDQIADKREEELVYVRRFKLLELANGVTNFLLPCVTMVVTFSLYTLVMKQTLTASVVFSSMVVFDLLRDQLHTMFGLLPDLIQARVSLDRMNDFLHNTELIDEFADKPGSANQLSIEASVPDSSTIGFRDASFTWSSRNGGGRTPGSNSRHFTLRIDDELTFKRGQINLIVGATGTGKTSLLMALLGEMHYIPSGPTSYFNLPRYGGVAYASQESWVQNETIKDNILFGSSYDEERYNKVIKQCGLERDLTLFEAGDQTEVGEKGLTLSGGQKARITLARAVYSSADILLLDDVLAALDVHTAKWIVDKCFQGDLIRGRTILLVTHNVAMTSSIADFIVSMGSNGCILSQGSLSSALAKDKKLSKELTEETKQIEKIEHEVDPVEPSVPEASQMPDGKLIVAEEVSEGHVGWAALKMWFGNMGGDHSILYWCTFIGSMALFPAIDIYCTWYLGYWAHLYELVDDPSEVSAPYHLTVYSLQVLLSIIVYFIGAAVLVNGCLKASRIIHQRLVGTILGTTLRWLDTTPISRVITRCTQDIQAIDGPMGHFFVWVAEITALVVFKLLAVVVVSPLFLVPGLLVAILGGWCGQIYMRGQLSVKREMSNARAPVLSHFGAAVNGLISIRAYGAQDNFKQRSFEHIDRFTSAARTFSNLNRWVSIRIEFLGGMFSAGIAAWLLYGTGVDASNTGFAMNMAAGFSNLILSWIRVINQFEVSGNSLERVEQYLTIEQEPKSSSQGVPPAYWPASSSLAVEKLSARYSPDGPKVLKDLSFTVNSGEHIGIVGRTGSGKSSLTLSLLRCIFTEGNVIYGGLDTSKLNLDALRSSITIIPQVPELLSGSLRQNLDPFNQYDDATLNDALRAAGLFSLQKDEDNDRITLDSPISSGGANFSVGQRQILALARAIVRRSKLLILDEATSAIDYETDTVIQTSLRKELDKDVTLLTVAHRLQTIMDADKIMVLDAGRIVEFGTPHDLLQIEKGTLRALVDESGDKDKLYAMVAGRA